MGIGYVDSIVLYNRYVDPDSEKEYYFGTQFEGVRVEMTQGANIQKSGIDSADSCKAKIRKCGADQKKRQAALRLIRKAVTSLWLPGKQSLV